MEVDIRKHGPVREDVRVGIAALRVQGRQIWGDTRHELPDIVLRLMVGVGDLARVARDTPFKLPLDSSHGAVAVGVNGELKKELGNILFSIIRWIDDLGLDPLECLDRAIDAQERFAKSGRPR